MHLEIVGSPPSMMRERRITIRISVVGGDANGRIIRCKLGDGRVDYVVLNGKRQNEVDVKVSADSTAAFDVEPHGRGELNLVFSLVDEDEKICPPLSRLFEVAEKPDRKPRLPLHAPATRHGFH